ncbi:peptide-N4-(N-acetyl-beta-glucosaminyl) asparagine amidase [Marchantia polymorpha subsp. ruderalis]|uniref:Transglutaminase-like domain-containing protein n=1 Tax=Marchantia polymorpha TaxID=3197 RepID=A0A2R6XDQ3_MARPO|nr:hypothetical protein MARPO_0021s0092 [Marchantia polymorpha]BBN01309.1 hypothetical protein Mp_2g06370 [Marchantia polymorpha subsp. ruderalis]|eukprot:PTQ44235.1 hypothetical protein MARPO_0021s0092 [Marchantia polymorpha]
MEDVGRENFLSKVQKYSVRCLTYEDPDAQEAARRTVNRDALDEKALISLAKEGKFTPTKDEIEHAFLYQLLLWFKKSFRWVNQPECSNCGSPTIGTGGTVPNAEESRYMCDKVELFRCPSCYKDTRFPRYNDPRKLLETRSGRCGEWANCFTLYCRAFGYKSRLVLSFQDHVWTECYVTLFQRWVHLDPCEGIMDRPLLYEEGWKKIIDYIIALSYNGVHDVTQRYTRKWPEVLTRRTITTEENVKEVLMFLTMQCRADLPPAEWEELMALDQIEEEEIARSSRAEPADVESLPGRLSGNEEWRTLRGEMGNLQQPAPLTKECPVRKCYDEHVTLIKESVGSLCSDIIEAEDSVFKVVIGLKALHAFLFRLHSQPFRTRELQLNSAVEIAWLGHANDETIALLLKSLGLAWTLKEDGLFWISIDGNPVHAAVSLPVALALLDKLTKEHPSELTVKWLVHGIRLCKGEAVASGEELPAGISSAAFDGLMLSKWEEPEGAKGAWIIYHLPKQMSHTLAAYEITSADDCPERDPYDWVLEGSNDNGISWKELNSQQGQIFEERFLSKTFEILPQNHFLCNSFRLRVTAVKDSSKQNRLQIACIDFIALKP